MVLDLDSPQRWKMMVWKLSGAYDILADKGDM